MDPGPPPTSVAVVGFMGAGKSAVGRALAVVLGARFIDTDETVVAAAGPIPDLFATRGEAAFRTVEREVAVAAIDEALTAPCVLALGGGAVLDAEVRRALRRLPHVVWLTAPADVLWRRVGAEGAAVRPLARDEADFERLLADREPLYREVATAVVDTSGTRPADLAADLAGLVVRTASDRVTQEPGGGGR